MVKAKAPKKKAPKQKFLEDYGVELPHEALIVIHFDKDVQKTLERESKEKDYEYVVGNINALKEEFAEPNLVISIYHKEHESDNIEGQLVTANTRMNLPRIGSVEPDGLGIVPHEHVFVNHRNVKNMDKIQRAAAIYMDLMGIAEKTIIPHLKKNNVTKVVIAGAQLTACVKGFAQLAALHGIEATIEGKATVEAKWVETKELSLVRRVFNPKITDYDALTPEDVKRLKEKRRVWKREFSRGPQRKITIRVKKK